MTTEKKYNIGFDVKGPEGSCDDVTCPFHGELSVRGNVFVGEVVSAKTPMSITVQWGRKEFMKKYERYEKKRTAVRVHAPLCFDVKEGDTVKIAECRPISKTKKFVLIDIVERSE